MGGKETLRFTAKKGGGNNSNTEYSTKEWLSKAIITELADSCSYTLNAVQQRETDYCSWRCFISGPTGKHYSEITFTSEMSKKALG